MKLFHFCSVSQVSFCLCIIASHSASLSMQMRVNNEPWPPHYSPPWNSQKSYIVSLRFPSQSSGTLFIVGGNRKRVENWYTGAADQLRIWSPDQLRCRQQNNRRALNASFQIWVRSQKLETFIYLLLCIIPHACLCFIRCGCALFSCARHLDLTFCHILEVGNSPADAPLIFWHVLHAWGGRTAFRGVLSRLLSNAIFQFAGSGTWLFWNCIYAECLCRDCAASALFRPVMSLIS